MIYDVRYAIHPNEFKTFQTKQLRDAFHVAGLFQDDLLRVCYTHYDRLIVGGAKPVAKAVQLESFDSLKADFFLQRREIGIVNVGGAGKITIDGQDYPLNFKEALYIGRGTKDITFHPGNGPLYYFNSTPAHTIYPTRLITSKEAEIVEIGALETSNHRTIRKLLVNSVLETCQLQMGLTELQVGSVWNTMPAHVHDRRMEVYFYFEVPEKQVVCHFMGEPQETRHLYVRNNEAVISPPWSLHSGAGTSNYSFIWGMAGENLDYSDMDIIDPIDLR
jgi:4-deoxy-L-threo-5-hexosulose-uronate ketol-isomerase